MNYAGTGLQGQASVLSRKAAAFVKAVANDASYQPSNIFIDNVYEGAVVELIQQQTADLVTNTDFNDTLADYVTNTDLTTTLADYVLTDYITAIIAGENLLRKYVDWGSTEFSYTYDIDAAPIVIATNGTGLLTLGGEPTKYQDLTNSGILQTAIISTASNNITLNLTPLREALSTSSVAAALGKSWVAGAGPPYQADSWFNVQLDCRLTVSMTTDNTQGEVRMHIAAGEGTTYTAANIVANTLVDTVIFRAFDTVKACYIENAFSAFLPFGTNINVAAGLQSLSNTIRVRAYKLNVKINLKPI